MIKTVLLIILVYSLTTIPMSISLYFLQNAQLRLKFEWKHFLKYNAFLYLVKATSDLILGLLIFVFGLSMDLTNNIYLMQSINIGVWCVFGTLFYWKKHNQNILKLFCITLFAFFLYDTFMSCASTIFLLLYNFYNFYGGLQESLINNIVVTAAEPLLSLLFSLLIAKIMEKLNFSQFLDTLFEKRKNAILIACGLFVVAYMYVVIPIYFPILIENYFYPILSVFLLIIFICIMFVITIKQVNDEKLASQALQIEQQNNYVESLENLQQDMRFIKHDFENIITGLYLQASEGDVTGVQEYLKDTLQYFDEKIGTELKENTQLRNIEVMPLKSLLLSKGKEIKSLGIEYKLEVFYPIKEINMEINDLLRSLGILIDNAIEEAKTIENAYINIIFLQEKEGVCIHIENPVKTCPILHKIYQKGYSSKGENRGLGLSSYRTILKRYPNVFSNTSCKQNVFSQIVEIKGEI